MPLRIKVRAISSIVLNVIISKIEILALLTLPQGTVTAVVLHLHCLVPRIGLEGIGHVFDCLFAN